MAGPSPPFARSGALDRFRRGRVFRDQSAGANDLAVPRFEGAALHPLIILEHLDTTQVVEIDSIEGIGLTFSVVVVRPAHVSAHDVQPAVLSGGAEAGG